LSDALAHCNSIKAFLYEQGSMNSQIKSWIDEAEAMGGSLSEEMESSTPTA
jgi:hypothetical protein